ncbi:hypothetical protein [Mycobacterium sp. RTGN5]|uniref:hypothetical protein n=1 Tax=Mycobacterium sp. RTGN5 TaxID=3016522 RepID=UPI0029C826A1|nr:hypothetical protein [Mycobacterium sp. RTGN5]
MVIAVAVVGIAYSRTASRDQDSDEYGRSTGGVDNWVAAVCKSDGYQRTTSNPVIMCNGDVAESGGFRSQIMVFEYASKSDMQAKRKMWDGEFGNATCIDTASDVIVVFKPEVSGIGSRSAAAHIAERSLQPLAEFKCSIESSGSSSQLVPETPSPRAQAPAPSTPSVRSGGVELPANSFGYVAVQTKSGRVRCMVQQQRVVCETAESNWPAHGVEIEANGSTRFANGNIGDVQPATLDYQTYRAVGWTITASSTGTRFSNDSTGHGAVVNVDRVDAF